MLKLQEHTITNEQIIQTIANTNPSYSHESDCLSDVSKLMINYNHRRIPIVTNKNDLIGVVTYMDILSGFLRGLSANTQISTFMSREIIKSEITDPIYLVLQKMRISRRGGIPLTRKSKLAGIVNENDFIKHIQKTKISVKVSDIMTHKPLFVPKNISILNSAKTMVNTHYRRLPIMDGNKLIGIVTGRDILNYINETNYNILYLEENISEIMSSPVFYMWEDNDITDAIELMLKNKIGGLPVLNEDNQLTGIITERDIIENLILF